MSRQRPGVKMVRVPDVPAVLAYGLMNNQKVERDDTTTTTHALLSTTDAMIWAQEWCRIATEIETANDGRQLIDDGWMVGWFANAIEVGRSTGRKEVCSHPDDERIGLGVDLAVCRVCGALDETPADASDAAS